MNVEVRTGAIMTIKGEEDRVYILQLPSVAPGKEIVEVMNSFMKAIEQLSKKQNEISESISEDSGLMSDGGGE